MKLAQALAERADIQKRLGQLRERLQLNARVQQGEKPAEQPADEKPSENEPPTEDTDEHKE